MVSNLKVFLGIIRSPLKKKNHYGNIISNLFRYLCDDYFQPLNSQNIDVKKIILLLLVALFSTTISSAQNGDGFGYGAKIGVNIADFTGSTGTARAGFLGGAFVDYNIDRLGFEVGVYYSQLGSRDDIRQDIPGNKASYKFDYLSSQLLAKYQLFSGFRVFVGPELSYLLSSKEYYDDTTTDIDYINGWDFGVAAGVGYSFTFGLDLSAYFVRGVTNIMTNDNTAYNSTFRVAVGWRF